MSDIEESYCRLCAEPTSAEQLITLDNVVATNSKITSKMLWINVDVSDSNNLPKAICFSCFDLLERTWAFLNNVRTAQQKLNEIYSKKNNVENVGKPVDKNWEDFREEKPNVKTEMEIPVIPVTNIEEIVSVDPHSLLGNVDIKNEPNHVDEQPYNGSCVDDIDDIDMFISSDSDVPLKSVLKSKKKDKLRKKRKRKHSKEVDNPDLDLPLDVTLLNMTWDDYSWRCAKCDAQCKSLNALRLHSLEIHRCCCIFKCSDCSKVFTNHKSFINHVKLHNKLLRYCCEICNKQCTDEQNVKKHKNSMHRNYYSMTCQNCGVNFDTPESLQDHILTYSKSFRKHKKKEKSVEMDLKCQHCNKEFKSRSNLQAHKVVHTQRSRDFSCHVCGKMFFTKGTLSTHMAIHEDVKPYKCDFCQMAFRARGNLLSHISLHSGTKPFVCEQCGKSFRVKRHLKSHSIVHTDLMPYICEYCNKPFRFKTRLNLHLRQHTGAKPYRCIHCQRDFTNGSNFKKHMKRRHNIDTSKRKYPYLVPIINETIENEVNNTFQ